MAKEYSIFIIHSMKYSEDLKKLRNLLNKRGYFKVEFKEPSQFKPIDSENEAYIKSVLKKKILSSNIVIAIVGMYASYSKWIKWEVETASNNNIPIIGVIPHGQEKISKKVTQYCEQIVRWNTESIVKAIREHASSGGNV